MQTFDPTRIRRYLSSFGIIFFIVVLLLIFGTSFWTVVSAGHTGVQSLFGKVMDQELSSGFHIKNPFVHVTELSTRTEDYTMSITQGEGERVTPDAIRALTKEGLQVDLDITVLYHLQEEHASDIYRDVGLGYDEVVIRPLTRSTIREIVAQYSAKDIYSEKRGEASQMILETLQSKLDPRGIEVEDVLLRNVVLPDNLATSIEAKLQAEQESERYDFVLEKEKKEAERKRIAAEGQRDAQQIINQSLTTRYLEYLYIESLKDREGTIYVPTNPSNGIPLLRGL
ncbi:MAG: band 7 protein [Candidatus Magasanikbacteria bacterium CG10_big_fil_rev_8_21_14_0_10_42_10]|uniref:Band 7 protein n=2 Tax=Candidatus Magasanikiibacteriota TaxID=1752731 RepID=A0A2H0TXD2_9BACT|nr:MAG: band 7 protein [Candidatus Magasanikbacteria bacterium CG10_big_fil_rev_8_21_14_0_10_42_10]PIZ93082.1 MAG: band 7 protein [Candidatus Magasanikbacteria bacterium CG_4_10_14_0_2_um_filter_41_10]